MTRTIVIIGCGGFGREVFSLVEALRKAGSDWRIEGFVDDAPARLDAGRVQELGSSVIGPIDHLANFGDVNAVIAIGSPETRSRIAERLSGTRVAWPILVHPDTTVGLNVRIGEGTVIAAGARISTNVTLGTHVHIDQGVTLGHDTQIGDFARVNPQACVSGSVTVNEWALIGANATVLQGVEVGLAAVVGAGACVVRDVAANTVVKGVPAR